MRYHLLILGLIGAIHFLSAQNQAKEKSFSIGYYAHLAIQPGLKIAGEVDLKQWSSQQKNVTKYKRFFLRPHVGFFNNPNVQTSIVLGTDFGLSRNKEGRKSFSAFSVGTAYLEEQLISSQVFSLADGSILNTARTKNRYLLLSANYELGRQINSNLGWYSRFSLSRKIAGTERDSLMIFTELGLKYFL